MRDKCGIIGRSRDTTTLLSALAGSSLCGDRRSRPVVIGLSATSAFRYHDKVQTHYRGELLRTYQRRYPMVRRGSTVRVRQRALQERRRSALSRSGQLARRRTCGGYGAVYGAPALASTAGARAHSRSGTSRSPRYLRGDLHHHAWAGNSALDAQSAGTSAASGSATRRGSRDIAVAARAPSSESAALTAIAGRKPSVTAAGFPMCP